MPLPSQSARGFRSTRGTYRRKKRSALPAPIVLGGGLLIAAALIWGLFAVLSPSGPAVAEGGEIAGGGGESAGEVGAADGGGMERPLPGGGSAAGPSVTQIGGTPSASGGGDSRPVSGGGLLAGAQQLDGSRLGGGSAGEEPAPVAGAIPGSDGPAAADPAATSEIASQAIAAARALIEADRMLEARETLNDAMRFSGLSAADRSTIRVMLGDVNDVMVFGTRVIPGDTLVDRYTVRGGDSLSGIAKKLGLSTDWRLIQRVNNLVSPSMIRVGQDLKVVPGPFHAVVDKSAYRLDLYAGPSDDPAGWQFVRSFDVGLGTDDSTPLGEFVVRSNGKVVNPAWVNPRDSRERYTRDDPRNPIGEYWIGLDGLGDASVHVGYGLHGTIEPDSIGRQESMGCVRLARDDIALMYELLGERGSRVSIQP